MVHCLIGFAWRWCSWWVTGEFKTGLCPHSRLDSHTGCPVLWQSCCSLVLRLILELNDQACTILSGDVIIRHLAQLLCPKYVVFLVLLPCLLYHDLIIYSNSAATCCVGYTFFLISWFCFMRQTSFYLICLHQVFHCFIYALDFYVALWQLRFRQMFREYMTVLQLTQMQYFSER
jgi:hypothetical protein